MSYESGIFHSDPRLTADINYNHRGAKSLWVAVLRMAIIDACSKASQPLAIIERDRSRFMLTDSSASRMREFFDMACGFPPGTVDRMGIELVATNWRKPDFGHP